MKQLLLFVFILCFPTQSLLSAPTDECANAPLITFDASNNHSTAHTVDLLNASQSAEPLPACFPQQNVHDVWYNFTTTRAGNLLVNSSAEYWALYDACNGNLLECKNSGFFQPYFYDLPIGNYRVRIASRASQARINESVGLNSLEKPSNDECSNAISVSIDTGGAATLPYTGNNGYHLGASPSAQPSVPTCFQHSAGVHDVWHKVTLSNPGALRVFDSTPQWVLSVNPTYAAIYDGCSGSLLGCNSDREEMIFPQLGAGTYWLRTGAISYDGFTFEPGIELIGETYDIADLRSSWCFNAESIIITNANGNTNSWRHLLEPSGDIIAEINANGQELGVVSASYWIDDTNPFTSPSGGRNHARREVTINTSIPFSNPISLRLYLKSDELNALIPMVADTPAVYLLKEQVSCNTRGSANYQVIPRTIHEYESDYFVQCDVNALSTFYFATFNLPIYLSKFKAEIHGPVNQLSWATVTQENASHFHVERMDQNGYWQILSQVQASGNSSEEIEYSFMDNEPLQKSTYRLKMMDIDGSFEYSPVEVVTRTEISDGRSNLSEPDYRQNSNFNCR